MLRNWRNLQWLPSTFVGKCLPPGCLYLRCGNGRERGGGNVASLSGKIMRQVGADDGHIWKPCAQARAEEKEGRKASCFAEPRSNSFWNGRALTRWKRPHFRDLSDECIFGGTMGMRNGSQWLLSLCHVKDEINLFLRPTILYVIFSNCYGSNLYYVYLSGLSHYPSRCTSGF